MTECEQAPCSLWSSSSWPTGIYVNVEFGVYFSQHDNPHKASMVYLSKNMDERLQRCQQRRQRQRRQHAQRQASPDRLAPQDRAEQQQQHHCYYQHQAQTSGRRKIAAKQARDNNTTSTNINNNNNNNNNNNHQRRPSPRGSSAPPPALEDRQVPVSHTGSFPRQARERPLPPLPSSFRLGEPDLPWSSPTFMSEGELYEDPTTLVMDVQGASWRDEDPQRVRELENLHQAMMTVDSLDEGGWDAWTWESVGDTPRGPRGLGWAISSDDMLDSTDHLVSRLEELYGGYFRPGRPRSSG